MESPKTVQDGPLSVLIYAYGVVKRMSYESKADNENLWEPLITSKRDFTGAMQEILDPRNRHKQFELAMKRKHARRTNS